ncbi:MaoC family dehydratase [Arthrobacter monumenti]
MSPVRLPEIPSLSRLYLAAAGAAAKNRMTGGQRKLSLPTARHEVHSVAVDVERLTQYQHLLHESARDVLPSGFIHAVAFPVAMSVMTDEDFPLPLLGMIHLRNHVEHLRPVQFAEPLDIAAWPERLSGHRAGTQMDMVVEVSVGAELVWRGVSTYLAKGVYLPGIDSLRDAQDSRPDFAPPAPTAQWRLGLDTGRSYAAVSGDFNPIHLSGVTAKALGMRRSIAHGMYLASRVLATARPDGPEAFNWDIEFGAPVFLPGTVALSVKDRVERQEQWQGADYVAWNPRSTRKHFSGSVTAI